MFNTFLEKGYYVSDVNFLAVMLLKLEHIESEQGKQTIITNVCHCVKACFTAVNIGLAIPVLPLKSLLIIYRIRGLM